MLLLASGLAFGLHAWSTAAGPQGWWGASTGSEHDLKRVVFLHAVLPRIAVAWIAGAALGLAGALFQRVLRNPIADASTLGISAGAQLAIVVATAFVPELGGLGRETVALMGGMLAVALVMTLTWRRDFEPTTVSLAGMLVSLLCASAGGAVVLYSGQYLTSMYLWGGGSLAQQSWEPAKALALRLALAAAASAVLLRPLELLSLGEEAARNLGLSVRRARLGVLAVAVLLASSVVSELGVIAFVGLAAPNLVRLFGARRAGSTIVRSAAMGALLLSLTDGLVQAIDTAAGVGVPTGAATALLGGPFLLLLLSRLSPAMPSAFRESRMTPVSARMWPILLFLALAAVFIGWLATSVGRDDSGLTLASNGEWVRLLPWRWPRLVAAMAAGAMLAVAGTMIQRLTGNPLASPEVLGVSSAAGVALAILVLVLPGAGWWWQATASALGAMAGLALLLAVASAFGLTENRMLMGGVALSAISGSILTMTLARGGQEAALLLNWLTGSTQQITPDLASASLAAAAFLLVPSALLVRWLQLLPLGSAVASGVGVPIDAARWRIICAASLLTGAATMVLGPVSFVGLMAPHIAAMLGLRGASRQLVGAAMLGALLMATSDLLSRLIFHPYQMPLGLFCSLIGAPYLIWALGRR